MNLDVRYTYFQLIETQAPANHELPLGQWRLQLSSSAPPGGEAGWHPLGDGFYVRITAIGDSSVPAFAQNPGTTVAGTNVFYVGNREILVLPLLGGLFSRQVFLWVGLFVTLLALGGLALLVKRGKLAHAGTTDPMDDDEALLPDESAPGGLSALRRQMSRLRREPYDETH